MSYTHGYTPSSRGCVIVDMRGLDRILEINTDEMYVTVECGCTWASLHEAHAADSNGNVAVGDTLLEDCRGSYNDHRRHRPDTQSRLVLAALRLACLSQFRAGEDDPFRL